MKAIKSLFKQDRAIEYSPNPDYYYIEPVSFADKYGLHIAIGLLMAGGYFVCWVAANQCHL